MIERLIAELGEKLDLSAEELADIIWLTLIRQQGTISDSTASKAEEATVVVQSPSAAPVSSSPPPVSAPTVNRQPTSEPVVGIAPRRSQTTPLDRLPIKVANPPSIRDPLALARSLRPLMRQVPSGQIEGLDEQATAQQIAEAGIWQPIVKPALEPWLELVLVADESASMLIWRQTVLEFRKLLRNYGAFRDVQLWGLYGESEQVCLRPGIGSEALSQAPRQPEEILDPSGRRLIVLITDCVAAHWQGKALIKTLKLWSQHSPVAIAQVLPEWLWVRTAIRGFESVQLTALEPGTPNSQLVIDWSSVWTGESDGKAGVCVPIVPLEPDSILTWSQMVMGQSEASGYWLQAFPTNAEESKPMSLSPEQRVERFQVMSSPVAQRLMGLVAATPVVTLPVIRLIQETLLPKSRQMNVAEVLLGGLLEPINPPQLRANPDEVEYRFVDEVIRDLLLAETPVTDTVRVLSKFIERQFDKSLDEFVAELLVWSQSEDAALPDKARPFATVTASVLKRKGGKYREFVQQIEHQYGSSPQLPEDRGAKTVSFPPLQEFDFETAKIAFEEMVDYDDLSSDCGIDYTRLRDLLAAQKWKDADNETYLVMLEVVARMKGSISEKLLTFPCTDLRTIDRLWIKYSKKRFGFSVQKKIFLSTSNTDWVEFGRRVGWCKVKRLLGLGPLGPSWITEKEVNFSIDAPEGHLPALWKVSPGIDLPPDYITAFPSTSQGTVTPIKIPIVQQDPSPFFSRKDPSPFFSRIQDCL
jgi:hypothetical protein